LLRSQGVVVEPLLFIQAALVGLLVAVPVGPIGLLCMQRTLSGGLGAGLATGLGAATADALYGSLGTFGLAATVEFFTALAQPLALGGSLFLGWLGWRLLQSGGPALDTPRPVRGGHLGAFGSTLVLTLANPMTILSFSAIFASLSGGRLPGADAAGLLVAGVFAGSALWWLLLACSVVRLRHRLSSSTLQRLQRGAGLLLFGFAGWQLLGALR
jgi:threonine/homoserine/homoserine lactone efflux protein